MQAAHEQNAAMADELAEQKRQTQHWQETAQQKLAEIEEMAARQREVEQSDRRQVTGRKPTSFGNKSPSWSSNRRSSKRHQAAQAAELQAAREAERGDGRRACRSETSNAALAGDGSAEAGRDRGDCRAPTGGRADDRRQSPAGNRPASATNRRVGRTTGARRSASRRLQAAELQAAREQNAAMAEELAEQKRQTQHWQETAQQKLAEIEGIAAHQREVEQTTAANHRQETDQLRQQIAELVEQQALVERQQAAQAAELQAAREQNVAMAEELADQKRQTQHWQEMAAAEAGRDRGNCRSPTGGRAGDRRQSPTGNRPASATNRRLGRQQALVERELAVPPAELQAAREQNAAMAEELADQKRQTQHWQEMAQQKLAEIEGIAAHQREVEQTTAASHRQETDQFRQQIAELIDQQALVKREQAVQAAELQAAREQNAAMAEELADQKGQTQQWQEMADCAKQVTELHVLFEHRQACQTRPMKTPSPECRTPPTRGTDWIAGKTRRCFSRPTLTR